MKKLLLMPFLALLPACQTSPAQIAAYEDECRANGAATDFQVFQCRMMLEERDRAQRERIADGLAALGQAMASQPQPVYQPTMQTTTCQPNGNVLHCTTF